MKLTQKLAISYIRARLHIIALVSPEKAAKKALTIFFTPRLRPSKKIPAVFETGEKLSFALENHIIRGYRWKPLLQTSIQGRKALILHGFDSNIKKFDQYIAALLQKGYEVLAFDAPAHGESGGEQLNLVSYIAMIKHVVGKYGPVHSFMAHSFGGLAVVHFLESQPVKPDTKLVLIAPATETVTSIELFFKFLQLGESVRKEFDELIYRRSGQRPGYFSLRRAMPAIKIPVLWLHDEEDNITPISDVLKLKADHQQNIRFVFTRGLGHRKIYRDPEVMKSVIGFL